MFNFVFNKRSDVSACERAHKAGLPTKLQTVFLFENRSVTNFRRKFVLLPLSNRTGNADFTKESYFNLKTLTMKFTSVGIRQPNESN